MYKKDCLPFNITLAGKTEGQGAYMSLVKSRLCGLFETVKAADGELVFHSKELALQIMVSQKRIGSGYYQNLRIKNLGGDTRVITHLSHCAYMDDIHLEKNCRDIFLHYFANVWEGEFQYRKTSFAEQDIVCTNSHFTAKSFIIQSKGSCTTSHYTPALTVEDAVNKRVLFANFEPEGNWKIECGVRGGDAYLDICGIDERYCSTVLELKPGEEFSLSPLFFGCIKGGFEDAVTAMTEYKRAAAGSKAFPAVFNDYMNCLWGDPSIANNTPLIDAAAKAGCEVFCIDAGWYGEINEGWGHKLGEWNDSKNRFGEKGLRGIIEYINSKGMLAGIWFELEVCGEQADVAKKNGDDWFLYRNGARIGGEHRIFFNFENEKVRAYLFSKLDYYYKMGVRYIKNDYNECTGNGGMQNIRHSRAVMEFYKNIRKRFPDLYLENCGSGALRCDYTMLKVFDIQSTSDQEFYQNYPSVLIGALANMPPEKAGIWSYPYPRLYMNNQPPDFITDIEQTIFNMVSGAAGVLYLSGRIDKADDEGSRLIGEGVQFYKKIREYAAAAFPKFPTGFPRIWEQEKFVTLLLEKPDEKYSLLYVWRLDTPDGRLKLKLKCKSIEQIYPENTHKIKANKRGSAVDFEFDKKYSARVFKLKK